jgi:hypothetical protein
MELVACMVVNFLCFYLESIVDVCMEGKWSVCVVGIRQAVFQLLHFLFNTQATMGKLRCGAGGRVIEDILPSSVCCERRRFYRLSKP